MAFRDVGGRGDSILLRLWDAWVTGVVLGIAGTVGGGSGGYDSALTGPHFGVVLV